MDTPAAPTEPAETPATAAGIRTTEFVLTAFACILGAALIMADRHADLGADIIMWATASYSASRAVSKGGLTKLLRR